MKLKFKHQQFQLDAVKSVVDCFRGQPKSVSHFTLDMGRRGITVQSYMDTHGFVATVVNTDVGYKNSEIQLTDDEILRNIQEVQRRNGLPVSERLEGRYNITVEMETGTGKTYTYIRTMFELYKAYGWSRFIVVVPSIAIREGVLKSFQMTEDHFMAEYGMKPRYFVYNSKRLHQIEAFASNDGINVMIINSQAFSARGKDARRIYMELDEFQSRRPIDVIASTRPILIIDEPQSVEGERTREALKLFQPLFTLRYSATHRKDYNKVYRLDAMDAYNMKLVKKISVKGISVKGTSGANSYLYLEGIDVSDKHAPTARVEFEVRTKTGLVKKLHRVRVGDDLFQLSGRLEQYRGYRVAEVNGQKNRLEFANGVTLEAGEVQGDVNELDFRRIQIRETIKSHFEKERELYRYGIKVLSLFFIDEVAKYRQYDEDGNEKNGIYAAIFEEEYMAILNEYLSIYADDPYVQYLNRISVKDTHKGYFSIDKRSNRLVDPKVSRRETDSDDVDAYELIMRDKERLLSFSEPTRFIFSHSALKEGWDNPNVFQICTLKHSDSTIKKRQEVGRGLRLCVNQDGERMDASVLGERVHDINVLTVIASESYEQFARQLQSELAETISDRPPKYDLSFFLGKVLSNSNGETIELDASLANKLHRAFIRNEYLDDNVQLTEKYFQDAARGQLNLPDELTAFQGSLILLLEQPQTRDAALLAENERAKNISVLKPNQNFYKKEFQELWNRINRKTVYTVRFDSDELIRKCIDALNTQLHVPSIRYDIQYGELTYIASKEQLEKGEAFVTRERETEYHSRPVVSKVKYDLVGKLMEETRLTRKTIVKILTGIKSATFALFRNNPEEFILRAARIINEQKATTIIEAITYNPIDQTFETDIFTQNTLKGRWGENAIPVEKHIYDFVITDSKTEQQFAKDLDVSKEVVVYAKLPRGFFIPTPVGHYNPDWAIVLKDGAKKHIYFIAETKGSMDTLELREVEQAKIECARKHFKALSNEQVHYDVVDSYEKLLEIVKS